MQSETVQLLQWSDTFPGAIPNIHQVQVRQTAGQLGAEGVGEVAKESVLKQKMSAPSGERRREGRGGISIDERTGQLLKTSQDGPKVRQKMETCLSGQRE